VGRTLPSATQFCDKGEQERLTNLITMLDMVFTLRMAFEIARVKSHPVYIVCVVLAKAYDSVCRETLWEDWYTRTSDTWSGDIAWMEFYAEIWMMDDRTVGKYTSWDMVTVHDLGYADDAAFIADTVMKLQILAQDLQSQYLGWRLHMSVGKTEAMATQGGDTVDIPMQTDPED